jgi:hypothetical protein
MKRRRRPLATLALIAVAAVISACGSAAPAGGGSGSASASASSGGGSTAAYTHKAVTFAKCMRRNGVSQFPDPSGSGKFTIDEIANGSSLDLNTPAFKQALNACKNLEPAGFAGSKWNPRQMGAALKFAQCIRKNGVSDFPDPVNGQPLINTNRIPSTASSSGMSALNAAIQKCRSVSPVSAAR